MLRIRVACNNNAKPETMTDADFEALNKYVEAAKQSEAFRGTITSENETKVVSITENCVTVDTTHTDADGNVTRTYYLRGNISSTTKVEAEAVYEGDATIPTTNNYKSNSSTALSTVTLESGVMNALDAVTNYQKYDISSAEVTKHSDTDIDYNITFSDDSGKTIASILVYVDGGAISSVTVTENGRTYTTSYEYGIGAIEIPATKAAWTAIHPEA